MTTATQSAANGNGAAPAVAGMEIYLPLRQLQAAALVCDLHDWRINNFELQNILFAAQALHMNENGAERPLIRGEFYAWQCGPVFPRVFIAAQEWKNRIVEESERLHAGMLPGDWTEQELYRWLYYWSQEIQKNISHVKLRDFARAEGGAWDRYYDGSAWPHAANIIPNEEILAQYQQHEQGDELERTPAGGERDQRPSAAPSTIMR